MKKGTNDMELDELKTRWTDADADALRINTRAMHALLRSEGALRWHGRFITLGLVFDAIVLVALGSFLAAHLREPRFFFPALLLHLVAIVLTASEVRQLVTTNAIDYGGSVVAIQRQLERARVASIRTTRWTLIVAPLLWPPLLIVTMKALLGVDAWAILGLPWLAANFAFGSAFLVLTLWIAHRYGARMQRSPRVKRLLDDLAGSSLRNATRFIDELGRFESGR
jgi:hypothetical protein